MLIVVMGMGRTGSSLVMQVLHAMGFDCGNDCISANEQNQRGYFESNAIVEFNHGILASASGDPKNRYPTPGVEAIEKFIGTTIPFKIPEHDYAIKDPRFTFTFPVWHPVLMHYDLRIIYTSRDTEAIAESLYHANNMELTKGRQIVEKYLERIAWNQANFDVPYAVIDYQDWFEQPEINLKKLEELLNRPVKIDIDAIVAPDLRHCRGTVSKQNSHPSKIEDGYVPLDQFYTDALKENLLYFKQFHPRLEQSIREHIALPEIEVRREADRFCFKKRLTEPGGECQWIIPDQPSQSAAAYKQYQTYQSDKQWLLINGIHSIHPSQLYSKKHKDNKPVVIMEPDWDYFISHLFVYSYSVFKIFNYVYWYIGSELQEMLLRDFQGKLAPHFINSIMAAPVMDQRPAPIKTNIPPVNMLEIRNAFLGRGREVAQSGNDPINFLMKSVAEYYKSKNAIQNKRVLLFVADDPQWLITADGMDDGFKRHLFTTRTIKVLADATKLAEKDRQTILRHIYQTLPDCLLFINVPSSRLMKAIESIPIPRITWRPSEPTSEEIQSLSENETVFYQYSQDEEPSELKKLDRVNRLPIGSATWAYYYKEELESDIAFIGNPLDTNPIKNQLPDHIIDKIDGIVDDKIKNPTLNLKQLISQSLNEAEQKIILDAIKIHNESDSDNYCINSFIQDECYRQRCMRVLSSLHDVELKIYGINQLPEVFNDTCLEQQVFHRPLAYNEVFNVYKSARIIINLHPFFPHDGPTAVDFDAPMCDGFVLSDAQFHTGDNLNQYLIPGKEIALFNDENDIAEKIKYYLDHQEERDSIILAAQTRINLDHLYSTRAMQIIQHLKRRK